MSRALLILPASVIFLFLVSPYWKRAYDWCQEPIWRLPADKALRNLGITLGMCCLFVLLFASTGGGLSLLAFPDVQVDRRIMWVGAAIGGTTFAASRAWALTQSQSFAQALYFSFFLGISGFFATEFVVGGTFQALSSRVLKLGVDDLGFLPVAVLVALASVVLSELFVFAADLVALGKPVIPYSLVREQLESAELYQRAKGEHQITKCVGHEIFQLARAAKPADGPFTIEWLSGNAPEQLFERMKTSLGYLPSIRIAFRAICHDDDDGKNRRAMTGFKIADIDGERMIDSRFTKSLGHFRIILVNGKVGFVGVQLGPGRQPYWPDYAIIIKEPLRLAILRTIFEYTWEHSK